MKCCSRSTFGVVIGGLNILVNIAMTAYVIVSISQTDTETKSEDKLDDKAFGTTMYIFLIVTFLLMTIISGLLIMGIVKRRHKLMKPFLVLSAIGFVWNSLRLSVAFILAIADGASLSIVFTILLIALIGLGLQVLIIWTIYTLYRDIRQENIEKPGKAMRSDGIPYQAQPNYYT